MSQLPERPDPARETSRKVLVVDDEPTLRLGFAYALSNKHTLVETADTGRRALEKIANGNFDLVVLDLRMPDIDGLGVIEEVRRQGRDVPFVLCSAALTPNAALRAIRQRVVDFLHKPVRPADLREMVDFVLAPQRDHFARAMHAARAGRPQEAIHLLLQVSPGIEKVQVWLKVLRLVHGTEIDNGPVLMEELLRTRLESLAFRSS